MNPWRSGVGGLILLGTVVGCVGGTGQADPSEPHAHKPSAHGHQPGHHGSGATVTHGFEDAERWSKVFDDPARDAWQKPSELVAAMNLSPGSTVADIGAGTGYLGPHLVSAVGPEGHVILADVESNLVTHMKGRFDGQDHVSVRTIPMDAPGLQPDEVDAVVLLDVVHHIGERVAWFRALKPGLREGAKVVIVDFKAGELPVGPPPEHRLAVEVVESELAEAGFRVVAAPDPLPHQYVRIFQVAD